MERLANNMKLQNALPALEVKHLSFNYGNRVALDEVSFRVLPGESVILLGLNGSGKTTLFSLISGLFSPRQGSVEILQRNLASTGASALSPLGIVFQAQTLDLDLTVRQNLSYFSALCGLSRQDARRRIQQEAERLVLTSRLDDKVRALNGGHRRRVDIARSLLHQPSILLLDEPTVGLDIPTRRALIAHLHERSRDDGIALLWATHLTDEVAATDHVLVLHQGRLTGSGKPAELMEATDTHSLDEAFTALTSGAAA